MGNKKGKKFLLLFFVPLAFAASLWFDREAPAVESEWPIEVSSPEGKILLYQPQPDSLKDDKLAAGLRFRLPRAGARCRSSEPSGLPPAFLRIGMNAL